MPSSSTLSGLHEFRGLNAWKERPSAFQRGIVVSVDQERWTVTVELHESGGRLYNIPMMQPYFYGERGQGMYCIPEIGAQCVVSDIWGQAFVLGFLPTVDPSVNEVSDGKPPRISYRCNRDGDMLPGDYCLTTRARNRIKMFTNGNVLVQASRICTRIYSKLRNFITDVCMNYSMKTPGGEVNWINDADDGSVSFERNIKSNVDDEEPSYVEKIGSNGAVVNRTVQTPAGDEVFSEQINDDGSVSYSFVAGAHEVTIDEDKVEISVLAGTHTILIDAAGIQIESTTAAKITTPGGILDMTTGGANWDVVGSLNITATGDVSIQPVGNLYLPA